VKWTKSREGTAENKLLISIKKFVPTLLYIGAFYISIKMLYIHSYLNKIIDIALLLVITYVVAVIASAVIEFSLVRYSEKVNTDSNKPFAIHWINKLAKALIWIIASIIFLQNLGADLGTLVAGLGVGGIAVAFAAQAILEDIFSYFTIFFDRPFEVGDFINTGEFMGTVEYIGLRTTRLRSISGEQLIFPNKDLTNARVKNFKAMEQRRVLFRIGVIYDTTLEQLKEIPIIVRTIIEEQMDTRFDRAHFTSYGDSSLNFEFVYYVLTADYNRYMDIQQEINYSIKERFDQDGIEFAFPTRTLYMHSQRQELPLS
jgi:small-conductance mechanosensitive channel